MIYYFVIKNFIEQNQTRCEYFHIRNFNNKYFENNHKIVDVNFI